MVSIGIITNKDDETGTIIYQLLEKSNIAHEITHIKSMEHIEGNRCNMYYDILIVNSLCELNNKFVNSIDYKHIILNVDMVNEQHITLRLNHPPVTVGINKRACVTASSVLMDSLTVCIQRKFVTMFFAYVVQQEIVLNIHCTDALIVPALSACTCALMCGVEPDMLKL